MSLTLREFANKYGIKKPTVNARLKKLERENPDKTLTVKTDNIIYLTENGLALLDKSFKDSPVKNSGKRKQKRRAKNKEPVKDNELIQLYQEQIKLLNTELKECKREKEQLKNQVEKLLELNSELTGAVASALKDSQKLLNQEQSLALIDKTGSSNNQEKRREKKSLLARLNVAGKVLFDRLN